MEDQKNNRKSTETEDSKPVKEELDKRIEIGNSGGGDKVTIGGGGCGGDEQKRAENSIGTEVENLNRSETLGMATSLQVAADCDLRLSSDHQLSEVPVEYELTPLEAVEGIKNQVYMEHQQKFVSIPGQAAHLETRNQLQSPNNPSTSELSPTSVTQSISSISSPTPPEQKLTTVDSRVDPCVSETKRLNSLHHKSLSVVPVLKKPSHDGYNWRKYGQKQVKSPQGSRSYYRCTYADCYAKKIECSDHTNRVIEIVYKSQHNHDPPHKVTCTPQSRRAVLAAPVNGHTSSTHSVKALNHSFPSTSLKDCEQQMASTSETREQSSDGSDEDSESTVKEEDIDEPEAKKRLKKSSSDCSATLLKPGKKPKFVVHAAGDVGISGDGYRWRKYGQKMVKGNPHPRNYYRCTSAGCPVRKHIESAVDNSNAVVITYKGIHDHDMPVPKKRQGLPSAPLVAAAAPASMCNSPVKKSEDLQKHISATKLSVENEDELSRETPEPRTEKEIKPARTLLSIGFEIKPC